jgi:hypothetical protein
MISALVLSISGAKWIKNSKCTLGKVINENCEQAQKVFTYGIVIAVLYGVEVLTSFLLGLFRSNRIVTSLISLFTIVLTVLVIYDLVIIYNYIDPADEANTNCPDLLGCDIKKDCPNQELKNCEKSFTKVKTGGKLFIYPSIFLCLAFLGALSQVLCPPEKK